MKRPNDCGTEPGFRVSVEWMKEAYEELCKQYFANDRMPKASSGEIVFGRKPIRKAHAAASCTARRQVARGLDGRPVRFEPKAGEFAVKGFIIGDLSITFSSASNNDSLTEKEAWETLIHEMIHIWQYLNETPTEWAASPHGRNFIIKSREARADGWDVGLFGTSSTRRILSPAERLRKKYGH